MYSITKKISVAKNLLFKITQYNIHRKITTQRLKMSKITPPDEVRGMKTLDRRKFDKEFQVPTLSLNGVSLQAAMNCLKKYLLKLDNFKPVQSIDSSKDLSFTKIKRLNDKKDSYVPRLVYLNPSSINKWSDFNEADMESLNKLGINEDSFQQKELKLTYENWKSDEIFRAILPSDSENLTSYSIVGHIIHLNLREHHIEYKNLIGEVLLDKVKHCTMVVNKTNQIDNTYRNFSMEILCGENNFITSVKENKCAFEFDFSKVYWNPRLCTEHERIVDILKDGDILFDVFAGVGPFAIPASKKKCTVYANDLNPESYKWLKHNAKLNKVLKYDFNTFNMDGREFIKDVIGKYLKDICANKNQDINSDNKIHITMNLPALAVEFLDAFPGLLKDVQINDPMIHKISIVVHVYCFTPGDNTIETAKRMVIENLGFDLNDSAEVAYVRNVSPNKEMMRVSFELTREILFGNVSSVEKRKLSMHGENEPECKQIKN